MDPKTQWRQVILEKRQHLKLDFVEEASHKIARKLFALEDFTFAERLALYANFRNEVATSEIFSEAHALRKEIYYPAVRASKEDLLFCRVNALQELGPGYAGILEPSPKLYPLSNLNYLNLIVVPGLVFDKQGNRIGFGGGYYDRLFQKFKGRKIALAFDFQVVDKLPITPRDQRVDGIVTEERIIKIN